VERTVSDAVTDAVTDAGDRARVAADILAA
jgi:hypothetical protein